MECCDEKCKYLNKTYNCCTRPDLNGRGVLLKKTEDGRYVKDCKTVPKEKKTKLPKAIMNNLCDMECPYLLKDVGCCSRPEIKKPKKLIAVPDTEYFMKECDREFQKKKKNKYHAKKIEVDGVVYDSKLEYERFCQLSAMQKAGEISDLEYHRRFVLIDKNKNGREIAYEADFVYTKDGEMVVEDVKSNPTKTRLYALKKRLLLERYGIKIHEYIKEKKG